MTTGIGTFADRIITENTEGGDNNTGTLAYQQGTEGAPPAGGGESNLNNVEGISDGPSWWQEYWAFLNPFSSNEPPPVNWLDQGLDKGTDIFMTVGTVAAGSAIALEGAAVLGISQLGTWIVPGTEGFVLWSGSAAAATTIAIGGSSVEVTVAGGVATVEVGFFQGMSAQLFSAVMTFIRASGGASKLILNTGPVTNPDLAIRLGLAAR